MTRDPNIRQQRAAVAALRARHRRMPLVDSEIFVLSARSSGYRSTATALDEFVDNSLQAGARRIDVVLGYDEMAASTRNLRNNGIVAIADDGHGMDPEVIRFAVTWGGTHRHDDRSGFGRYGFGLPAAACSIGKRFTVYSRVDGAPWHAVTVDLDDVAGGRWTTSDGIVETPDAVRREPPSFVTDVFGDPPSGTIVVIETLDQLSSGFVITRAAVSNLLTHLGTTYRGILGDVSIRVVDTAPLGCGSAPVRPVDPLFLDSAALYHDDGRVNAEPLPASRIDVRAAGAEQNAPPLGSIVVRYSYLAPGFQDGDNRKARLSIMTENNGLLALRAGRQVDVVRTTPKGTGITIGQVYDRNWGCEIDFPPALDEEFGVTVNKQQVSLSDRMWSILADHGVFDTVHRLQRRYADEAKARRARTEREATARKLSESVADRAAQAELALAPAPPQGEPTSAGQTEREARLSGGSPDLLRDDMIESGTSRIDFEHRPGAPHYRTDHVGGQRQLWINTAHRFFTHVYSGPDATPGIRTALELLLFAQADCEIDVAARPERDRFYQRERTAWGIKLDTYLSLLDTTVCEALPQTEPLVSDLDR